MATVRRLHSCWKLGLVVAAVSAASAAHGAVLNAGPGSFDAVLARARGGDTIVLTAGDYAGIQIRSRIFSTSLTLDARRATFRGLVVQDVTGLTIRGGAFHLPTPQPNEPKAVTERAIGLRVLRGSRVLISDSAFVGPGTARSAPTPKFGEGYGLLFDASQGVEVSNGVFTGFVTGVTVRRSQDFRVARNAFHHMRSDGVQIAESQRGVIEDNICRETRIRDAEHPDCIQLWSRATYPPTGDIVIRRNDLEGDTQGIGLFNHIQNGVDDGGFDRIVIEDNRVAVSLPNAIAMNAARNSIVRNNRVTTLPNAQHRASINLSSEIARCGNIVNPGAGKPGIKDPAC